MAPSPVVARWELSRRLATRRKELGIDVKTITDALDFTRNYWSAVENDRTLIAAEKLRALFDLLQFDEQDQQELLRLREESRARGWWDEYPWLDDAAKRFYGREAGAVRIRAYDSLLLPGVLQTQPYARAVIAADPVFSPIDHERVLDVRRRRQQHLLADDPPSLQIVLSEAALRQQVAGPAVQSEQLRHIHRLASVDDGSVEIRVIPFDVNPGVIASSSTLLFFLYRSHHLPEIAIQEAVRHFDPIDAENDQFSQLSHAWNDGSSRSLSPEESAALICSVADELEQERPHQ